MRKKRAVFHLDAPIARALGVNEAIVSYHLCFWIETNEREGKNFVEGRYWTYNSVRKFSDFIDFLSEKQIKHALNNLYDAGYLLKGHYSENKLDRSLWYSLSDKYYQEVFGESIVPTGQITLDPQAESIVPTGQMYISKIINIDIKNKDNKHSTRTQCASERSLLKSHPKAYSKRYTNEEIDSAFESFWLKYPKKENKQEAKKAYINALNGVYTARSLPRNTPISIEELQSAVEAYSKHLEATGKLGDKSFLPNATTWLNNQRYDNAYNNPPTNEREAIAQFNQQNGLRGDSAIKGYYNLPRHLQEERSGNWEQYAPKTEEERKERERIVKELLGWEY